MMKDGDDGYFVKVKEVQRVKKRAKPLVVEWLRMKMEMRLR